MWTWLTGKKTYLSMAAVIVAYVGRYVYPEGEAVWQWFAGLGAAGGAVGLTHKVIR